MLLGAGHAHLGVLRAFAARPIPGARITLITRERATLYSGMLPGVIAGAYTGDEAHIDLAPLAQFADAHFCLDEAVGIDPVRKLVSLKARPPIPFDVLSIDIGSATNTTGIPGATDHVIAVKPIGAFLQRFERLRQDILNETGVVRIATVGAGAAGVELLLAVEHRLRAEVQKEGGDAGRLSFMLLADGGGILPGFPSRMRTLVSRDLEARSIRIETVARVNGVTEKELVLADGRRLPADHTLWATEASPASWLRHTGLALTPDGFLRVDQYLRAVGHDAIFAAGDTVAFEPRPLPRSGVFAVRAAPVLAHNMRAVVLGRPLRPFRPQRAVLSLLSTADGRAVGTRNGITVSGAWAWRWKRWLDCRFVQQYRTFPVRQLSDTR